MVNVFTDAWGKVILLFIGEWHHVLGCQINLENFRNYWELSAAAISSFLYMINPSFKPAKFSVLSFPHLYAKIQPKVYISLEWTSYKIWVFIILCVYSLRKLGFCTDRFTDFSFIWNSPHLDKFIHTFCEERYSLCHFSAVYIPI